MKRILFCFTFIAMLISGCSNESTGKKEDLDKKAETVQTVEDTEKENTEKQEENVEEAIVFKKSTPIKMDKSLPLEPLDSFKTQTRENENEASYHLDVTLKEDEVFDVKANINIKNLSKDTWGDLIFYFIPNAFTEKNKPEFLESQAVVNIGEVLVDGKSVDYKLQKDTLQLLLDHPLNPNQELNVEVAYSFTVPTNGIRFSKAGENSYLAQWYPMLSTYHSGWDKTDYEHGGESYHNDFSQFTVNYQLPDDYVVASSADNDPTQASSKGSLHGEEIKEFYITFMKNMNVSKRVVDGTEIRVFSYKEEDLNRETYLNLAEETLLFFNKNIGKYPHKQLDIIMDQGGMEYPGIVTVSTSAAGDISHTVVHEMAHQWFYGMVNNHPYYTAWIDEALTNYAAYLFFIKGKNQEPISVFSRADAVIEMASDYGKMKPSNLSVPEYKGQPVSYSASVYENSSLELWKLSDANADKGIEYLRNYFNLYSYKEVDANEWLRYTRSFFQIKDVNQLSDWISFEE
ncbi:M1 family metallopeptidase [Bacillus sp. 31A1R]|uniref:M1 family metallopeptidase n=1 Tax=Robertmurraya mangrovi TaxID=3098077 RepID=A0ABU5J1Z0_9BACI|nr:M1 family metallopeptidase [Bacillus sp. 31A1R]MDZ5473362.1 M1 family metallopeptidase [Bacillus sp. 31A1R]